MKFGFRIAFSGVNPGYVKKRGDAFGVGMPYPGNGNFPTNGDFIPVVSIQVEQAGAYAISASVNLGGTGSDGYVGCYVTTAQTSPTTGFEGFATGMNVLAITDVLGTAAVPINVNDTIELMCQQSPAETSPAYLIWASMTATPVNAVITLQ